MTNKQSKMSDSFFALYKQDMYKMPEDQFFSNLLAISKDYGKLLDLSQKYKGSEIHSLRRDMLDNPEIFLYALPGEGL